MSVESAQIKPRAGVKCEGKFNKIELMQLETVLDFCEVVASDAGCHKVIFSEDFKMISTNEKTGTKIESPSADQILLWHHRNIADCCGVHNRKECLVEELESSHSIRNLSPQVNIFSAKVRMEIFPAKHYWCFFAMPGKIIKFTWVFTMLPNGKLLKLEESY